MGAALILCRVARACARRSMPPDMTSAEFCSAHGDTFVAWLRDNTQECKCDEKYGNDEARQRGDVINADNEILCRRCFVPVGLQDVRPPPRNTILHHGRYARAVDRSSTPRT